MIQFKLCTTVIFVLMIGTCAANDPKPKCYQCDSASSTNCITNLSAITSAECESGKCFTKNESGKITRGCWKDGDTCQGEACRQCDGENCNNHKVCKSCTSSNDGKCSQTAAEDDKYNYVCEASSTGCVFKIGDDKHLTRRCATADEKDCTGDKCKTCTDANCNTGIFPSNRRLCYQCKECGNVANSESAKLPCVLYNEDEKCYTYGTSTTDMTRGCVSDAGETNKCSKTNPDEKCATCDSHNCNNRNYTYTQIKCVQCTNCNAEQQPKEAKECKEIPYNKDGQCYTEVVGGSVTRGCIFERTAEGKCEGDKCAVCSNDHGCNYKAMDAGFTCIKCRSNENSDCRKDPQKITGEKCTKEVDIPSCFAGVWKNIVIRGCLADADNRQQIECQDKTKKHCDICSTPDCNKDPVSGAATLKITSGLFLGILMVFWRLH